MLEFEGLPMTQEKGSGRSRDPETVFGHDILAVGPRLAQSRRLAELR